MEALRCLVSSPRIIGWCGRSGLERQFQQLGELVELVPVVQAVLPWGPPFAPDLVTGLLDALPPAQRVP